MTALLILPQGSKAYPDEEQDEETTLREVGAEGQIVNLHITDDEGNDFGVWMGIDPAMPVNSAARLAVAQLSAVHIMCFGPVLITQLDEDLASELIGA